MPKLVSSLKESLEQKSRVDSETQMPYVWLDIADRHLEMLYIKLIDEIERGLTARKIQVLIEDIDYNNMTDDDGIPEPTIVTAVRFEEVMEMLKQLKR